MATIREELEERCKQLPQPPFFALLPDPQQYLSAVEQARAPYLRSQRLFTVAEIAIDRCFEQPGIWFRATGTLKHRLSGSTHEPKSGETTLNFEYQPTGADIWLNAEWCILYNSTENIPQLRPN